MIMDMSSYYNAYHYIISRQCTVNRIVMVTPHSSALSDSNRDDESVLNTLFTDNNQ